MTFMLVQRNTRVWIRGLVAAIVGGAANAVTVMIIDPVAFNLGEGIGKVGMAAAAMALVGAALYLKQHPLPDEPEELRALAKAVEAKQDAALP